MGLKKNLIKLLEDIDQIAATTKRDPEEISLVVVTKSVAMEVMQQAFDLDLKHFGENRVQEFLEKMPRMPKGVFWHFIGPLQKNKVRKLVPHIFLIHSVDSLKLAERISQVGKEMNKETSILLQVNTSGETSKQGFSPKDLKDEIKNLLNLTHLRIKGLMTMAPYTEDTDCIRSCFRKLRELRDELNQMYHCQLDELSMGMTFDYKIAIEEGATILRIGSALFGCW